MPETVPDVSSHAALREAAAYYMREHYRELMVASLDDVTGLACDFMRCAEEAFRQELGR